MRFSMLYSGEQILSFKSCLVFYARNSLTINFAIVVTRQNDTDGKTVRVRVSGGCD